ncbi:MAG: DinB family protein [Tepidiformaceae bacterium]
MTPNTILRDGFASAHRLLTRAVEEMTAEQFNFRPREGGVSAFFSLWHCVRTEDNIVNFVIQRRNTVWLDGGYDEAFGLPRTSQGTLMTEAEANAVTIADVERWSEYQRKVWDATDDYVASLSPEDLTSITVRIKPVGEMALWNGLFDMCLTHNFRHAGEIEHVRGIQGLGGLTI